MLTEACGLGSFAVVNRDSGVIEGVWPFRLSLLSCLGLDCLLSSILGTIERSIRFRTSALLGLS